MRGLISSDGGGPKWDEANLKWAHTTNLWNTLTDIIARGINTVSGTIKGVSDTVAIIRGIKN